MPSLEEIEKRRQQNKKGSFKRKPRRPWDLSGDGLPVAPATSEQEPSVETPDKVVEKVMEKVTQSEPEKVTDKVMDPIEDIIEKAKPEIIQPEPTPAPIEPTHQRKPTPIPVPEQTAPEPVAKIPVVPKAPVAPTVPITEVPQAIVQPGAPAWPSNKPALATEYRVRMLRGLKKKLLKIIVNSCLENSTFITPPLFMEDLIQLTGKSKVILKARLSDLKATGLVIAHSRRGVGGYYQFEVDQEVINAVKKYL